MPRRETAYGQVRNVVVFIFPTTKDAEKFVRQLELKNLMNKIGLPRLQQGPEIRRKI